MKSTLVIVFLSFSILLPVKAEDLPPSTIDGINYMAQFLLKLSGYDPGELDGVIGPKTNKAIVRFQKDNGMRPNPATGSEGLPAIIDGDTYYKLFSKLGLGEASIAATFGILGKLARGDIPKAGKHPIAARIIGTFYLQSDHDKEAFEYFLMGAEQGDIRSQVTVGALYELGTGVTQNDNKALMWYLEAAKQGDPEGQYMAGIEYGSGHNPDYREALKWMEKSANNGYPKAKKNLHLFRKAVNEMEDSASSSSDTRSYEERTPCYKVYKNTGTYVSFSCRGDITSSSLHFKNGGWRGKTIGVYGTSEGKTLNDALSRRCNCDD
jgi:peptidoglycan hydrolase-like protein with peptidoglycan-binding domain